jgi:GNAT superfamily N-acetyltransferase
MIRACTADDFPQILAIINDGAGAYRGVIPADRWTDPYMASEKLSGEMADGVAFWGFEQDGLLLGVMGIQDVLDVTLIRHAYVRTTERRSGIGSKLLTHLESLTKKPVLIGTWADAGWAIGFYEKHGFSMVTMQEKNDLLLRYWKIPARQVETSVVLRRSASG